MRKIYISKKDRKIFGVCGGIGEAYNIDSTLVRLALVFLCLVTAVMPVLLTYLAAWIIVPEKPEE